MIWIWVVCALFDRLAFADTGGARLLESSRKFEEVWIVCSLAGFAGLVLCVHRLVARPAFPKAVLAAEEGRNVEILTLRTLHRCACRHAV